MRDLVIIFRGLILIESTGLDLNGLVIVLLSADAEKSIPSKLIKIVQPSIKARLGV